MATALSDMSFWIKFFKEAGIPAGDAANYAVKFSDNRITRAMLMDLTKEYLSDMGIAILGDVISILKHAKSVHSQDVRERVLRDNVSVTPPPTRDLPAPKRSTPASRTIAHHLGPDRSASPTVSMTPVSTKISKALSARLGTQPAATPILASEEASSTVITLTSSKPKEVVPVPRKRRVFPEHEGKYKITMPTGTTAKTQKILENQRRQAEVQRIKAEERKRGGKVTASKQSVFARLGSEKPKASAAAGPTITITGLDGLSMSSATQSSVFNRLGGKTTVKRAATSTVTFGDDDVDDADDDDDVVCGEALEYAGVLKPSGSPAKKVKLDAANRIKKMARTTLAAKAASPVFKSEGIFAGKGDHNIKSRLGPKIAEASSTTQAVPTNKAGKATKQGIQSRLGGSPLDKLTITVDTTSKTSKASSNSGAGGGAGIFSRLGKPK